ncbi:MAG TPA: hypothetical protein VF262_04490, partial [Burkholderiales bacterium]
MLRRIALAALALCFHAAALAQFQQQRQDDLGILSAPQTSQQGSPAMGAPVQQVNPLQTPPV